MSYGKIISVRIIEGGRPKVRKPAKAISVILARGQGDPGVGRAMRGVRKKSHMATSKGRPILAVGMAAQGLSVSS